MINIKICIVGNGGVGKTSIKQILTGAKFKNEYVATMGTDFSVKDYEYTKATHSTRIRFLIFDLAGQKRYRTGQKNFMVGSHAVVLVYDISNKKSIQEIPEWLREFKSAVKRNVPIVLVGNKIDLREKIGKDGITYEDGIVLSNNIQRSLGYGENIKFHFVEVSAKENIHVNDIFDYISSQIYDMYINGDVFG